jgi:hypothetical protein
VKILEMSTGQYLAGLFNLDGQVRLKEYLDDMAILTVLRLAVGSHVEAKILPTILHGDLPASQWGSSDFCLGDWQFTIMPIYFRNHWTVAIVERGTAFLVFFDSSWSGRNQRGKIAVDLVNELRSGQEEGKTTEVLRLQVIDVPQQHQS